MQRMQGILKKTASFLKWGDLFATSQFLRYRGETDYGTVTGGFVSVAVLIVFAILFANVAIETANRKIITSSVSLESDTDPSPLQITVGPKGGFGLLIGVLGFNLNDPAVKYFDISLTQSFYGPLLTPINSTTVPLEQCRPEHFDFGTDIAGFFKKFTISWALCPPLNYQLNVGGRVTSDVFSQFTFQIAKCNATANPKCISDPMIAGIQNQIGYFTAGVSLVTPLINPGDEQYIQYSINDRNTFYFTIDSQAVKAIGQLAQMEVDTDISIMPYSQIVTQYFIGMPEAINSQQIPVVNDVYAVLSFTKSPTYPVYTRSFNKVDGFLSYVGGLVSTIIILFFILSAYAGIAFYLQIASKTFILEPDKQVPNKSFNFLHFILMGVKDVLSHFRGGPRWPLIDDLRRCRDQGQKEVDISHLLNRIHFLENTVSVLLSKPQQAGLFLKKKPTLQEVIRNQRRRKALKLIQKGMISSRRVGDSFISANNEGSESPNKSREESELINEEHGCIWDCSDSSEDEESEDVVAELREDYNNLANQDRNDTNTKIMQSIDKETQSVLRKPAKTSKCEVSVKNLNSLEFYEIEEKPTDLNGKDTFEFIK